MKLFYGTTLSAPARLFDTNLWVALAFGSHPQHTEARRAFDQADSAQPAMFCRVTQQAFVRHLSNPTFHRIYASPTITNRVAWEKWELLMALPQVGWLEEPDGLEAQWKKYALLNSASPKVWMDAYLAALALSGRLTLVTFDSGFKQFAKLDLNLLRPA